MDHSTYAVHRIPVAHAFNIFFLRVDCSFLFTIHTFVHL